MRYLLVLLMMLVGAFNAAQAPINASLSRRSSVISAVLVSFLVGAAIMVFLALLTGSGVSSVRGAPAWQYLGGLTAVTFVLSTAWLVTRIGLAAVIAANVSAQLVAGMLIDRWGLFGLQRIQISWVRVTGGLLLLVGAFMVARK